VIPRGAVLSYPRNDYTLYASQLVEDSNNWLAFHNLDLIESYIKGGLEIALKIAVGAGRSNYDLVFVPIPTKQITGNAVGSSSGGHQPFIASDTVPTPSSRLNGLQSWW
jgi:hypothetical protein